MATALPQVLAASNGAAYVLGLSLLAQQQSGAWQYPLPDGLGSVRQWTDASSQVTYAARYAPFGAVLWQQGSAPGPWGFAGEMQDPTGLIYLRARWYDPATGRFLTRDPFPGLPTQPATLHPYTYALNNPVLYVDPTGEFLFLPLLAVAAAGGLLGGLGYYGIQAYMQADPCTGMPWDWGEALFWGGVGTVMGAGIGVGIYGGWWVGVQLGWWGSTSTITTGTYVVYRYVVNGVTRYIGMTSDFARRAGEHLRQHGWQIERIQGLDQLSRVDARAVEQVLIEHYGLDNLLNQINSIAATNPIYQNAIQRGTEILNRIGFFVD